MPGTGRQFRYRDPSAGKVCVTGLSAYKYITDLFLFYLFHPMKGSNWH